MKRILVALWMLWFALPLWAQSQEARTAKIQALYDTLVVFQIEYPRTVTAIAIVETGWLECSKCAFKYNNLFGFRGNGKYMRFDSQEACIAYLKVWQQKNFVPWKEKHPKGTYHQFLTAIKYAENMPYYLRNITNLERWVSKNIQQKKEE